LIDRSPCRSEYAGFLSCTGDYSISSSRSVNPFLFFHCSKANEAQPPDYPGHPKPLTCFDMMVALIPLLTTSIEGSLAKNSAVVCRPRTVKAPPVGWCTLYTIRPTQSISATIADIEAIANEQVCSDNVYICWERY
jgi:hypothetical protein